MGKARRPLLVIQPHLHVERKERENDGERKEEEIQKEPDTVTVLGLARNAPGESYDEDVID